MNMLTVPILVASLFGVAVCDDDETMALVRILLNSLSGQIFHKSFNEKRITSRLRVVL